MSAALIVDDDLSSSERIGAAAFVLALRAKGVVDLALLRAMERVPRELFAPRRYADLARTDVGLPLPFGQTMTAPAAVAAMLGALAPRPGEAVLEIGTGSGYVAALLAALGAAVRSLERLPILAESAATRLRAAGFADAVDLACADGLAAPAGEERYGRILLNGAVRTLPPALTSRLAAGGRLVCGLAGADGPRLLVVTRGADGALSRSLGPALRLAPLREAEEVNATAAAATEA